GDHGPISCEIDQRRENAAMGVAALRVDDPFLAPRRRQFDAALAHGNHFQTQPSMIRSARQQLLDVFDARNLAHVLKKPRLTSKAADATMVTPAITARRRPCRSPRDRGSVVAPPPPFQAAAPRR